MKKIGKWIFVSILLPLLKDLLKEIMISISKYFLDWIKQKMNEWKEKEMKDAKTEEDKEIIKNKWNERMHDVEGLKTTMGNSIGKIVDTEILKSEQKVNTIEITSEDSKLINK